MGTAPTAHDTPKENADRMGARIKSNRLGSISKTSASAQRGWVPLDPTENAKTTAKVFKNASEKQCKRQNMRNRRSPTFVTAEHQKEADWNGKYQHSDWSRQFSKRTSTFATTMVEKF